MELLAARKEGWTKEDEEKWDEAIGIFIKEMEESDECVVAKDRAKMLRFPANIAIARSKKWNL